MTERPYKTVSALDVAEFMVSPPTARVDVVDRLRGRGYDLKRDYYKQIRDALGELSRGERSFDSVQQLAVVAPSRKQSNYMRLVESLQSFLVDWDASLTETTRFATIVRGLRIRVSPEIGVRTEGRTWPTKLWLRSDPPSGNYIDALLAIFHDLRLRHDGTDVMPAVLDLQRGNFHRFHHTPRLFEMVIEQEADALLDLWDTLDATV